MSTHSATFTRVVFILAGIFLFTQAASAQNAGIGGVVSDDTGGVLPGVTVTAASPVLIEGQRLAVTDAQGRYAFAALLPGGYSITFSLPGFNQVLRDGIELAAGKRLAESCDRPSTVIGSSCTAPLLTSRRWPP